jgi:hypothetical protein
MLGKLKCKLGFHVGYPEKVGDWMTFYCTQCNKHVHPISPEQTEAITETMLREDGYDELADERYGENATDTAE